MEVAAVNEIDVAYYSGEVLRKLINENYPSQEEFAYDFGADLRTISRYINEGGLTKTYKIQELAMFFNVSMKEFFPD